MTSSLKSLRYTTAIAVSLVALSTANQAQAQCTPTTNGTTGNDTIICTGASGDLDLMAGDDVLTNNGTIAGIQAIISSGGSDTIINSAGATIDGFTEGVLVNGTATLGGGITNGVGSTIRATSGPNGRGLHLQASGAGDIVNNGTISGGLNAITLTGAMTDFSGDIINNGVIENLAGVATTVITVNNGANLSGELFNSATGIIRGGSINAVNVGSGGADISGGIRNAGLIDGNNNGIGVGSTSAIDLTGAITNSGIIRGTTGAGIFIGGFSGTDTTVSGGVVNTGTITGNIGVLVEGSTSSTSTSAISALTNSGTIEGTGGTAIQFEQAGSVSQLNIDGGQIIGDVVDDFGEGNVSNVVIIGSGFDTEGDFTVSSLAVNGGQEFRISTGDTFNTRGVSTAGTINFEVDAAGDVGLLNVTAGAIDLTGGAVGAEVDAGAALVDGQEILIGTGTADVIGTAGATGQALLAAANDSLLFDFSIADGGQADITGSSDASELFFLVSQAASAGGSAITNNANGAGATVNTLLGSVDPGLSAVLANVSAASSSEELEAVLQAVLPQVDGASLSAAQNVTNNTIRLVSDRLTSIRGGGGGSGVSSGDLAENLQVWAQVFGQIANQGERKGIAGFDADTYGTTFGVDTEGLYDGATIGVALSYANTDVDSDNATNTQSDINSYNVTLYGDYDLSNDSFIVGDIGYTYGDNETTRSNIGGVAGLNADSDYDSHQIQARVIVGRDYHPAAYEGLHITPKAQARYTHFRTEDIEETGAGGANLNVDSDSLNIFEVGVGVDVRKDYVQDNGGILSPEISVGYRYDLVGDAVETTSTFAAGGPSFRTEGADPDQDTFNLGVGLGYTAPNNMEFTASYDYEHKDEFNSSSAFIRVAAPF